jgi:hypothetical protein
MPLQKLQFRPGVNREGTTLSNEGGWYDCDKIRFRSGYPEKLGGWQSDTGAYYGTVPTGTFTSNGISTAAIPSSGAYWGIAKALWNWINLTGYNLLSVGTNLKYYIQNTSGGAYNDITPIRAVTTAGVPTFSAVTTSPYSTTITVTSAGNGVQVGDFVTFSGAASLGGNITATVLNREYQVQTVTSNNTFTITASVSSNASDTGTGGGSTIANYQLSTGNTTFTSGTGWGAGGWGGSTGPSASTPLSGTLSAIAFTSLTANLTTTTTTVTVASTAGFTATGSILIESEVISYTGVTSTSFTGCTRAASGTTAAAHTGALGVSQYTTGVTINCTSASVFAASGTIYIDAEGITYSGKTATSFTGCTRAANGTTPNSHASGALISQFASTATGWGLAAPAGLGINIQLRLWSQSNYGEDLVFNPRGGSIYYWANNASPNVYDRGQILKASTPVYTKSAPYPTGFTPDSTCPSIANFVLVSDSSRFTFAFGTNDPSGYLFPAAQDPMLVRWSDQNTLATWTPAITNQAGDVRLSHGSAIITAIQTRQEILVLTDAAIYSFQYLGAPYVWGNQLLADNISIVSPNAAQVVNNVTYWMGADKFYMYSGRVETLPCALRQYIYGNINLQESYQIHCGTNEGYNEIWWFYPSITGTTSNGQNGTGTAGSPNALIDRYVIYNHLERTWYYGTLNGTTIRPRTAWLDSPLRAEPMAAIGYTATNSAGNLYYTNGGLVYHETGVDNNEVTNTPLAIYSYVQSSDFDIGDGHNFGFVWRLIPDLTFDGSTTAAPNYPSANFTVRPRQNPGANYGSSDDPTVASTQSYASTTTYNVQQFTQQVFVRIRGRQMAFKIESGLTPTDLGTQWQLGAPRIDVRPDGRR